MHVLHAVVIGLAASACNAVFGLSEPELHGLDERTITFDNSASRVDLVDFPVLIRLDAGKVTYSSIADPHVDLRFEDVASGTDLPFDVERWTFDGESLVWVRVPVIHAHSTTDTIVMHVGPDAHGHADMHATWADHDVVMHGNPGDYTNAAADAYGGAAKGITQRTGIVGDAYQLAGPAPHSIALANSGPLVSGWSMYTLELWLYADYADAQLPSEPVVIDKHGVLQNGRLISVGFGGFARIQIDAFFAEAVSYDTSGLMPTQAWTYLAWSFDGQALWMYRDGQPYAFEPHTAPTPMMTSPVIFGSDTLPIVGGLDEIRISHTFRDPNWIGAQYRSMTGRFAVFN